MRPPASRHGQIEETTPRLPTSVMGHCQTDGNNTKVTHVCDGTLSDRWKQHQGYPRLWWDIVRQMETTPRLPTSVMGHCQIDGNNTKVTHVCDGTLSDRWKQHQGYPRLWWDIVRQMETTPRLPTSVMWVSGIFCKKEYLAKKRTATITKPDNNDDYYNYYDRYH